RPAGAARPTIPIRRARPDELLEPLRAPRLAVRRAMAVSGRPDLIASQPDTPAVPGAAALPAMRAARPPARGWPLINPFFVNILARFSRDIGVGNGPGDCARGSTLCVSRGITACRQRRPHRHGARPPAGSAGLEAAARAYGPPRCGWRWPP